MTTEVYVVSDQDVGMDEERRVVFMIHGQAIHAKIVKGAVRLSTGERERLSVMPEASNAISVRVGR